MAKSIEKDQPSVINIIQEMLQKGESEAKIISTLKEIGISEEQIKNLLLISKSNTFTLLKSEVSKATQEALEREMPKYKKTLYDEVTKYNETNIKDSVLGDAKKMQNSFEQKQYKELQNITEIVKGVENKHDKIEEDIVKIDTRIEEVALGSTKTMKALRVLAFVLGAIFLILVVYKFFTLGLGSSVDYLVLYVLTLIAGIVLMVLSLM